MALSLLTSISFPTARTPPCYGQQESVAAEMLVFQVDKHKMPFWTAVQELAQGPQDTVRLQMVLQGRDKQLDDLSKEYTERWQRRCMGGIVASIWRGATPHGPIPDLLWTPGETERGGEQRLRSDAGQAGGVHPESAGPMRCGRLVGNGHGDVSGFVFVCGRKWQFVSAVVRAIGWLRRLFAKLEGFRPPCALLSTCSSDASVSTPRISTLPPIIGRVPLVDSTTPPPPTKKTTSPFGRLEPHPFFQ